MDQFTIDSGNGKTGSDDETGSNITCDNGNIGKTNADNTADNDDLSAKGRSRRRQGINAGIRLRKTAAVLAVTLATAALAAGALSYFGNVNILDTVTEEISTAGHRLRAVFDSAASDAVSENAAGDGTSQKNNQAAEDRRPNADDTAADSSEYKDGHHTSDTAGMAAGERNGSSNDDVSSVTEQNDPEHQRQERLAALISDGYHEITQSDPDSITISFAGDILFDEHYAVMASMLARSGGSAPDISNAFDEAMLSEMRGADIFMVNNEFPYSDRGEPLKDKQFTFRARPQHASLLKDMGADIVALANNHVNDYGTDAMTDTFSVLQDIAMPYAGAGMNIEEASSPVYFTNGDVRIAVIAATQIERMPNPDTVGAGENSPGVFRCMSATELSRLTDSIADAKSDGCFVIVYVHWGTEGTEKIDSWQIEQGKAIADAGADIIIGDHPHVLQGLDYIGDRKVPVIYSLGNYLFNSKTLDTCLFKLRLNAQTASIEDISIVPAVQSGCRTTAASGAEARRILTHLQELSPNVVIDTETGSVRLP